MRNKMEKTLQNLQVCNISNCKRYIILNSARAVSKCLMVRKQSKKRRKNFASQCEKMFGKTEQPPFFFSFSFFFPTTTLNVHDKQY